jgi:hypothetical protein
VVYKLEPAEAIGRAAEEEGLLLSIKGTYAHAGQQSPELGRIKPVIAIGIDWQQIVEQPSLAEVQALQAKHQLTKLLGIHPAIPIQVHDL